MDLQQEYEDKKELGEIFIKLSKNKLREKDIEYLNNIIARPHSGEYYYISYTFLGIFHFHKSEFKQSIINFTNVTDEYEELFYIAQYYIGLIYYLNFNNTDKALEHFNKIRFPKELKYEIQLKYEEYFSNMYPPKMLVDKCIIFLYCKYFNKGCVYNMYYEVQIYKCYIFELKCINTAIKYYEDVIKNYNCDIKCYFKYFLEAHFNLGLIYFKKYIKESPNEEYKKKSINYFKTYIDDNKIDKVNNKDYYKKLIIAKFLINYETFHNDDDGKFEEFTNFYKNNNIELSDVFNVIYNFLIDSSFNDFKIDKILNDILSQIHNNKRVDKIKDDQPILSKNIPLTLEKYPFTLFSNLLNININDKNFNLSLMGNLIFHCTKVLKHLFIKYDDINQISHYTSYETSKCKLLNNESKFRLNLANFMNDPTEGQVLSKYLKYNLKYKHNIYTFLASFSLNINNLNLFRLYGKKNDKEGTGLSLAIKENFLGSMNIENKSNKLLDLQPLYRCIYINPESYYINIAKKHESSFYQELKNQGKTDSEIKSEFKNYQKNINNKLKDLKKSLKKIKDNLVKIKNKKFYKNNEEVLDNLIDLILLPIRFLVKHSDFEEEAECRIIYVTDDIKDDNIKKPDDEKGKFYMEYQFISNSISEIYLGPKVGENDKMTLDYLCNNEEKLNIKIKKSDLPLA